MDERHDRSIKSTTLTLLSYIKEIRSLAAAGDEFHTSVRGRPTAEEANEIESILACIEGAITEYWNSSGLSQDEKKVKWQIFVLAQFMEDLVDDMRPERLSRTHGSIDSEEQVEKLARLCERLDGQIRRLKALSSK
jgi:hypothetical protein